MPDFGGINQQPLDNVLQFTHVAGPVILLHGRCAGVPEDGHVELASHLRQNLGSAGAGQQLDIFAAFAQRRQAQVEDIEAVIEVGAKQPLLDLLAQVAVRGGDDAHVHRRWFSTAKAQHFTLLQHPQQAGLQAHRHFTDFVEKQGAGVCRFDQARFAPLAATGECAFFVAE